MNRTIINRTLALFVLLLAACASSGSGTGTGLSLMDAIEQTGEKIAGELPKGSRVAIVAFESMNDNVSDYIMEELTGALFDRGIEVADRQNLEYVYKELNLQMSGDVSDESAKSIGKFLGADMVITGQLIDLDGAYRYRTSAVSVEEATRASVTRLNVRSDAAARRMIAAIARQQTSTKVAKYGVSEKTTPQTAGTFIDRGIMFASRGEFEMAIADFTEALKLDPNMGAAYKLRGAALYASVSRIIYVADDFGSIITYVPEGQISMNQTHAYEQVIADYTQAIRLNPNDAIAYANRGNAYSDKSDYDRAIADYTQAIRLNPNYTIAYANRATAYIGKSDLDRAITDYNQAIRLDPNNVIAYYNRGKTYDTKKDYDRAIADYTQAIRLDPNHVDSYIMRGNTYYRKGDLDRAITDYTQAIRLNPNYAEAYANRGNVYANKGDWNRAIADYEAALRLDPNNADCKKWLENARRQRGR
ncbi:MAG: tetratricopeptide repeat protein [Treponema sp.]|jgi:tetratricopeptide (TPR) repeat protein|nr:tetratricopeptide repeat protein [Treponema sp.]